MEDSVFRDWLTQQGVNDQSYQSSVEVLLILLATAFVAFIVRRLLIKLERQLAKTKNHWDDNVVIAVRPPLLLLVWVLGISLAIHVMNQYFDDGVFSWFESLKQVVVIACLMWFVIRFISGAEKILVDENIMREPMDETTVSAIGKLLRAAVIITCALVVLQTLGYSVSGVLAFGGIGGIAVGFAAKDLLANFFGGLMIYLDRPFKVGDWVRSPDREIEGTVENIGWRLTTIRTFDKRPLYVPNASFTTISVQNPSRMSHRRIYETIGVRYDDAAQVSEIVARVKSMLKSHEEIDQTQTMIVNFNAFAPSSLDFFVYTFTKTTNWVMYHEVKQDVLLRILDIISDCGAEVAFPTSTVHLSSPHLALTSEPEALQPTGRGSNS